MTEIIRKEVDRYARALKFLILEELEAKKEEELKGEIKAIKEAVEIIEKYL